MSIANYLTFIRIFISPIFLLVYMEHETLGITQSFLPFVLLFLLGASELSDALDGHLARKYNQVTDLGKILDPMADSISRLSIFLTFTQGIVQLPLLLVFVFLYRDSVVSTLRIICALKGFALAARTSGKIKAGIQACSAFIILVTMMFYNAHVITLEELQTISFSVVLIAAIYTAYSGLDYIWSNRAHVKKLLLIPKADKLKQSVHSH